MTKLEAVIFDMDGVLIDSEPFWRIAELEVFHAYQIPLTEEMCKKMTGTRIDQLVEFYLNYYHRTEFNAACLTNQIIDHLIGQINHNGIIMAGVEPLLEFIKEKNLPIGLASSSALRIIQAVLAKFKISHYFDIVCSGEFEPYGKPHPAVYLTAAHELQKDPYRCLAIEDSFNGLIAAKAARMKCIVVPEESNSIDQRFKAADLIVTDLTKIKGSWSLVEEWFI